MTRRLTVFALCALLCACGSDVGDRVGEAVDRVGEGVANGADRLGEIALRHNDAGHGSLNLSSKCFPGKQWNESPV